MGGDSEGGAGNAGEIHVTSEETHDNFPVIDYTRIGFLTITLLISWPEAENRTGKKHESGGKEDEPY